MKTIAVVGTGPVGLATVDMLSRDSDVQVIMVDTSEGVPATFKAAAAFWTPFSSGVDPATELELSKLTLDFYENLRDAPGEQHGIIWRRLEQYWLKTHCIVPDWRVFESLDFDLADEDQPYSKSGDREWRLEFSYNAPVINVTKFRDWYQKQLISRENVETFKIAPIKSLFCLLYTSPSPRDRG